MGDRASEPGAVQRVQFLVGQGRLTSAPTAAQIAAHVDPTFIKKALAGGC